MTTSIFDRVNPELAAVQTADLTTYIAAIAGMFQLVADIIEDSPDGDPGYSPLLDLNRCPDEFLPWLAQFIGIRFNDPSITPAQQRTLIAAHVGWDRGTPAAMKAAIRPYLTGAQQIFFTERDTSPYHFAITTFSVETPQSPPGTPSPAIINAINAAKPAGLQYTYSITTGGDYTYAKVAYATYAIVKSTYATYNGLLTKQPGT